MFLMIKKAVRTSFSKVAYNVSRLCAGWDLEHESFNLAQKPISITAVEFSNSAPLAQNRC